ncbi:MAG: class I SAM-dependent methyltransferase [Kiritimatiellae bacterium]|nr:class I SAM-dependent methyltransferase [Kiritimatiellia bacterium]
MNEIILKPGRDHSVTRRHPWIFSGAIAQVEGAPAPGDTVRVRSSDGAELGWGAWSPESQMRVRMWSFDPAESVDASFIERRLAHAIAGRATLLAADVTNACRLVNAESDGLPGLVVDRYDNHLVCQITTAGMERWKSDVVAALTRLWPCAGIYERSDAEARAHEGLAPAVGALAGAEPPERIEIQERGCRYLVDVRAGHKTGFYLDQRDNRALVAACATGGDMLNVFAYTGGFGIAAMMAGAASVTHVELSADALALARENSRLNVCDGGNAEYIEGNAFEVLRTFRDARREFDLIVLDPPKFADAKKHLMAACRGYKDINLLAFKLLRPGGVLATFSCSGLVSPEIFHKVVSDAAVDARRDVQVLQRLQQAGDHPEGLFFPEGLYLKGLLCRVW